MGLQTVFPALLPSSSSPLIQVFNQKKKKKKGMCADVCMWRSENYVMELVLAHSSMGSELKLRSSGLLCKCYTHGSILLVIQPRFSSWHHRGRHQHFKGSWEQRAAADHHDPMYSFPRVWQLSVGDRGGQVHSERGKAVRQISRSVCWDQGSTG